MGRKNKYSIELNSISYVGMDQLLKQLILDSTQKIRWFGA